MSALEDLKAIIKQETGCSKAVANDTVHAVLGY
jgi:hypothetical protein